jgi:hypothetical protein
VAALPAELVAKRCADEIGRFYIYRVAPDRGNRDPGVGCRDDSRNDSALGGVNWHRLLFGPAAAVWRFAQRRFADGLPLALGHSTIPAACIQTLTPRYCSAAMARLAWRWSGAVCAERPGG